MISDMAAEAVAWINAWTAWLGTSQRGRYAKPEYVQIYVISRDPRSGQLFTASWRSTSGQATDCPASARSSRRRLGLSGQAGRPRTQAACASGSVAVLAAMADIEAGTL